MLTATVNKRISFRAKDIANAKQKASKEANKYAKKNDNLRIVVTDGSVTVEGKTFKAGEVFWLMRFNEMAPKFKPGKWVLQ